MKKIFSLSIFCLLTFAAFAQNDATLEKPYKKAKEQHNQDVIFLGTSPNWKFTISGSRDNTIKLWETDSMAPVKTFAGHISAVQVVAMNNNCKFMLSGSDDGQAILWDVEKGSIIQKVKNHQEAVNGVAFSPDENGKFFYTAGEDGKIQVYDRLQGVKFIKSIITEGGGILGRGIPYGSRHAIIICKDGKMREYDLKAGTLLRTFEGNHTEDARQLVISPDGKFAATCSDDKRIIIWNIAAGKIERTFEGHTWKVFTCAFNPTGQYLASGSIDGTVRLWNVADGTEMKTWKLRFPKPFNAVTFTSDSKYVIAAIEHSPVAKEDFYWWTTGLDLPVPPVVQALQEETMETPVKNTTIKNPPVKKPAGHK